MPDLPTFTINDQATYDRVVAAFNKDPAQYREWLKARLIEKVQTYEFRQSTDSQLSGM